MQWKHTAKLQGGNWLNTRGDVIRNTGWQCQADDDGPEYVALFHHYSRVNAKGTSASGRFSRIPL